MSTIFGFDSLYTEHGASYNAIATVARVSFLRYCVLDSEPSPFVSSLPMEISALQSC